MVKKLRGVWPQVYKMPSCQMNSTSSSSSSLQFTVLYFHLSFCISVLDTEPNNFDSVSSVHFFTGFQMHAKILFVALVASPLVAAHGKVAVVVSNLIPTRWQD
jgi:hypothetical protein